LALAREELDFPVPASEKQFANLGRPRSGTPLYTTRVKTNHLLASFRNLLTFLIARQGFQLLQWCRSGVRYSGVGINVDIHVARQGFRSEHAGAGPWS
jgi:hypothetical protein